MQRSDHPGGDYITQAAVDAENTMLASMMTSPRLRHLVRGRVGRAMLATHHAQALYDAIEDADQRGALDADTHVAAAAVPALVAALQRTGSATGALVTRLHQTAECTPLSESEVATALEHVESAHASRVMATTGRQLMRIANAYQGRSLEELRTAAADATVDLTAATTPAATDGDAVAEDWEEFLAAVDESGRNIVRTGFLDLDKLMRVRRGNFVVVGARTSIGKSAFGLQLATRMTSKNEHVRATYLSYEMSRQECRERLACAAAGVRGDALQENRLTEQERERLAGAGAKMPRELFIPDAPSRRLEAAVSTIHREAAKAETEGRTAIVFVDYVQQLTVEGRFTDTRDKLEHISNNLQQAAQETGAVVVALAQLNRGPESRTDKRPEMSDVRGCDSFAHDAHNVILLHRPDFHDPDTVRQREMDLLVEKNRGGARGTVTVAHHLEYSRITDMARGDA